MWAKGRESYQRASPGVTWVGPSGAAHHVTATYFDSR